MPYPWPYDGDLDPGRLALVVAGAQVGWTVRSSRSAAVATVLLAVATELRAAGASVLVIRHAATGRGARRALPPTYDSDDWKLTFAPRPSDVVVDAAGVDGFHGGPLDDVLRARGIDHLVLGGFGHEAAVDSTLRSANDRGYECLVLTDGVAPFDERTSAAALASVTMSGGIFGALGTSADLVHAIRSLVPTLEVVP